MPCPSYSEIQEKEVPKKGHCNSRSKKLPLIKIKIHEETYLAYGSDASQHTGL